MSRMFRSAAVALVLAATSTAFAQERSDQNPFDLARALRDGDQPDLALEYLDELAFLIETGWGLSTNLKKLGFTPQIYSPYYQLVSKKLVRNCHAKNMQIIPWTVNDVPAMRGLIRLGVDGIITDYPNLIREVGKG